MTRVDDIRRVVDGALRPTGLVVEDVTLTPAGRRRVARVLVDRDLGDRPEVMTEGVAPLSLDEVSEATRVVSDALDETDVMGEQPYTLEVSTPGVDRPLREPRHFRRNVGRLVRVGRAGDVVVGRLVRAGLADLTLVVPATATTPAREEVVAYDEVSKAVVEVEFRHPGTSGADEALRERADRGRAGTETEDD